MTVDETRNRDHDPASERESTIERGRAGESLVCESIGFHLLLEAPRRRGGLLTIYIAEEDRPRADRALTVGGVGGARFLSTPNSGRASNLSGVREGGQIDVL